MNAILNTLANDSATERRLAWAVSRFDATLIAVAVLVLVAICLR